MKTKASNVQNIMVYESNDMILGTVVVVHCTDADTYKNVIAYLKNFNIKKYKTMKGFSDAKIVYFKKVKVEEITKYLNTMIKKQFTVEYKSSK